MVWVSLNPLGNLWAERNATGSGRSKHAGRVRQASRRFVDGAVRGLPGPAHPFPDPGKKINQSLLPANSPGMVGGAVQPPFGRGSDRAVMETSEDAAVSKFAAVRKGYYAVSALARLSVWSKAFVVTLCSLTCAQGASRFMCWCMHIRTATGALLNNTPPPSASLFSPSHGSLCRTTTSSTW